MISFFLPYMVDHTKLFNLTSYYCLLNVLLALLLVGDLSHLCIFTTTARDGVNTVLDNEWKYCFRRFIGTGLTLFPCKGKNTDWHINIPSLLYSDIQKHLIQKQNISTIFWQSKPAIFHAYFLFSWNLHIESIYALTNIIFS